MNEQQIVLLKWLDEQIEEINLDNDLDRDIWFLNKGQQQAYKAVKEYLQGIVQ